MDALHKLTVSGVFMMGGCMQQNHSSFEQRPSIEPKCAPTTRHAGVLAPIDHMGFVRPSSLRWEEVLRKVPHDFFHLPGYLSACETHEGGEALLFILEAGEHGMLVPLLRRSLAEYGEAYADYWDVGSPYGYPSPLYWGLGWQDLLPEMHAHFYSFLRENRVVSLFLRLNPFVGAPDASLAEVGDLVAHGPTVYIDLRDAEQSWRGVNSQNRTFINRMLKAGCRVEFDAWDTVDTVIEAYYETMRRLNASPFYFFSKDFFLSLKESTNPHFHLATTYAPNGEITGGVFFSEVEGLIQYYLTGCVGKYAELSPNKLMINGLRLWGLERGHHTLHLGGGLGARRDSLFEFKVRLSKSLATFSTLRKVILPEVYRALTLKAAGAEGDFFPAYRKL